VARPLAGVGTALVGSLEERWNFNCRALFWSATPPAFVSVCEKYLPLYVAEFQFRL